MSSEKIKVKNIPPVDRFNPNQRIYVRESKGHYQKLRRYIGTFLMLLMAIFPWLSYQGQQAVLFDLQQQQFNFFSTTLYPQDLTVLALLFIVAAFGLFFITTFLGRVWCGYLCPQTVWTFIYIWFEQKLEGNANKRRQQDKRPLTPALALRKTIKHALWLLVALLTSLTFVGYFMPIKQLAVDLFTLQIGSWSLFWIMFFTLCTYFNAGWMRSIVCLHMCPYARFQSAMFDKDTFIVGYHPYRGEPRGPRSRKAVPQGMKPKDVGLGDCIDCNLCVQVCPTGIDIRNGLQYECINCGACIDACDTTMRRMGYPIGLINYTTESQLLNQLKTAPNKLSATLLRPKLLGYGAVILIMLGLLVTQVIHIEPAGLSVIRDRNQLFRTTSSGQIENTYNLKIINKTQQPQQYALSVSGIKQVTWIGKQQVIVKPGEVLNLPISLSVPAQSNSAISVIQFQLNATNPDFTMLVESRFIQKLSP